MTNKNLQENRDLLEKIFNKFDRYRSGLATLSATIVDLSQYLNSLGNVNNMNFNYYTCSKLIDICENSYLEDLVTLANEEIDKIEYELRKSFNMPKNCCLELDFDVMIDKTAIKYVSYSKIYRLLNQDLTTFFYFCYYCGYKFSYGIYREWLKISEKFAPSNEYNYPSVTTVEIYEKLPKKYQTDQWWKELLEYMDEEEIGDEEPETPKAEPSKKGHCCSDMDMNIEQESTKLIKYEKHIRKYLLTYYHSKHRKYNQIHYCSYCGTKLPKSLEEEWKDILEKEFGSPQDIEVGSSQWQQLPEEFKTDEWWKKRGL